MGGKAPDYSTVCPTMMFGPLTEPFYQIPVPDFDALITNIFMYSLIVPHGKFCFHNFIADVRDVARAHVMALKAPPTALVGRKRLLISSPHGVNWKQVVDYLAQQKPELKDRLITAMPPTATDPDRLPIDFQRIEAVIGMKTESSAQCDGNHTLVKFSDSAYKKVLGQRGFLRTIVSISSMTRSSPSPCQY
jgi:nucleoside-diphosphate-sugar epimerase